MAEPYDLGSVEPIDLGQVDKLPSYTPSPISLDEAEASSPSASAAAPLPLGDDSLPVPIDLGLGEPLDYTPQETAGNVLQSLGLGLKAGFMDGIVAAQTKMVAEGVEEVADGYDPLASQGIAFDEAGDIILGPGKGNLLLDGLGLIAQYAGLREEVQGAAQGLRNVATGISEQADRDREQASRGGFENEVATAVGQSLGFGAPAAAAAVATGGRSAAAMLGSLGYFTYADGYTKAREKGLSEKGAQLYGATQALIETATEAVPLKALFKDGKFVKRVANYIAKDVPGELAATTLQSITDWYALNPEMTGAEFKKQLAESLVLTAVSAPIAGALQGGGLGLLRRISEKKVAGTVAEEIVDEPPQTEVEEDLAKLREAVGEIFWHGTNTTFTEFDPARIGTGEGRADEGVGVYLTGSPESAQNYAEAQADRTGGLPTTLEVGLPKDINLFDLTEVIPEEVAEGLAKRQAERSGDPDDFEELYEMLANMAPFELLQEMRNDPGTAMQITEDLKSLGFDGLRYGSDSLDAAPGTTNVVIFDSSKPKILSAVQANPTDERLRVLQNRIEQEDVPGQFDVTESPDLDGNPDVINVTIKDPLFGPVGTLRARANPSRPGSLMVQNTSLDEDARGQGLGQRMYMRAVEEARRLGFTEITSDSDPSEDAQRVWRALGAELVEKAGRADPMFRLDVTKPVMTRRERLQAEMAELRKRKVAEATEELAAEDPAEKGRQAVADLISSIVDDPKVAEASKAELDYFGRISDLFITNTWMGEINGHIPGVREFGEHIREWWTTKNSWSVRANDRVQEWNKKVEWKNRKAFDDFLFTVSRYNDENGVPMPREEMLGELESRNLPPELLDLAEGMWEDFRAALAPLEEAAMTAAERSGNPQAIAETRQKFNALRVRQYLPHSRFGKYTVVGKARSKEGKLEIEGEDMTGRTNVFFEAFESKREAKAAADKLRKKYGSKVDFQTREMDDTVRQFQGLPPELLTILQSQLDLTQQQQQDLRTLALQLGPAQRVSNRMLQRARVPGFSRDGRRVYADYFQRISNHIARIMHNDQLREDIKMMEESLALIANQDATARTGIIRWHKDMVDYLNNPGNEWAWARSAAFTWHLGFNVKSAAINLTQLPLVTLPYLQARHGNADAARAMGKSMAIERAVWRQGRDYTNPDHRRLIDELTMRGIVDESQASELAALTEGNTLWGDTPGGEAVGRGIRRVGEASSFLFTAAEKFNRRITAVAAYDLARKQGLDHDSAVDEAHRAVEITQAEYARFNRPRAMRGKLGVPLVFMQYVTHMLWFMRHDEAGMRYLAMLMFAAGAMGLPFAENLKELMNLGVNAIKKQVSPGGKPFDAEQELREFITALNDAAGSGEWLIPDAELVMKGIGGGFTPFDVSGSLSMGNILPFEGMNLQGYRPGSSFIGDAAEQAAGAAVAIPISIANAIGGNSPDLWKRTEGALPAAARNLSRAARFVARGREVQTDGTTTLVEFDPTNWTHLVEVAGQAAGFPIRRVNEARESRFRAKQAVEYYNGRRSLLMHGYYYGWERKDTAYVSRMREKIRDYNSTVPFSALKISGEDLKRSLKSRARNEALVERGIGSSPRYQRLYKETLDAFGDPIPADTEAAQ